jgi:hypothetical protein
MYIISHGSCPNHYVGTCFHVSLPVIPKKTTDLFSKLTFDGEGNTYAVDHISKFCFKCLKNKITNLNLICRLFSLTFQGWVKYWFESFRANFIHSWSEFVIKFLSYFNNYDYDELGEELSFLRKENDESFKDFSIRFIHFCTRFPLKEMPLIDEWFQYLISLSDKQYRLMVNQYELSTNTQSQYGLKFHDDLEVIKATRFLSTPFILADQEKNDILQYVLSTSDISLSTMSSSIEEGTFNLKGDNDQTLQDIIIVYEVKEMECEVGDLVVNKFKIN